MRQRGERQTDIHDLQAYKQTQRERQREIKRETDIQAYIQTERDT